MFSESIFAIIRRKLIHSSRVYFSVFAQFLSHEQASYLYGKRGNVRV